MASTANPMQTPEFCIQPMALKSDKTHSFIMNTRKYLIDSQQTKLWEHVRGGKAKARQGYQQSVQAL
jgi:hypothetical protein